MVMSITITSIVKKTEMDTVYFCQALFNFHPLKSIKKTMFKFQQKQTMALSPYVKETRKKW